MGMWNCGKPPATEKNKAPMCKALQLMTQHFNLSWRVPMFLSNKRCLSIFIFYYWMERLLAKRWGETKKDWASCQLQNIWHAESINKTLFKASRFSSHRLFKRLDKMQLFIFICYLKFLCLYTGKESWRQRWREHISIVSWNDTVQMARP